VVELGFSVYLQRAAASDARFDERFLEAGRARLWSSLPYLLLVALYFVAFGAFDAALIALAAGSVFALGVNVMLTHVLYGKGRYREAFVYLVVGRGALLAALGAAWFSEARYEWFFGAFVLGEAVRAALALRALRREGARIDRRLPRLGPLREILGSSTPFALSALCVILYDKIDIILLSEIGGLADAGMYAVAYALYRFPQAVTPAFYAPLFTNLSKTYAEKGVVRLSDIATPVLGALATSAATVALYFAFAEQFVPALYGSAYAESAELATALSLALPGVFLNNATGVTLNAARRERTVFATTLGAAVVNVALNIALIPTYGAVGAVVAMIATEYSLFGAQAAAILGAKIVRTS
ncbi:MAG: oligosaccharide flippase family protein, partial [Ignavibacteriales bacterium]|nr:oligosaccharide flippase family protein [Ignavibacteriales bacterium]